MSEQNVALVRAILSGANQDRETILAGLDEAVPILFSEDVEFIETPERVDARTFHGHEGVKEAFTRFLEQWGDYSGEITALEDYGDQVLAVIAERATGAGSGAPVESTLFSVFDFRAGKVCRYREFYDEAAARAALG